MTNIEFVDRLLEIHSKYKTRYAKGTFGQKATDSFIDKKAEQYPEWYKNRKEMLKALPDDTRLFDCCGLIKGCIWNFPNIVYTSNGLRDVNDQMIWDMAQDKSYDFSNIQVGELLWIKSHVGVYIGDGKAIECTSAWKNGVQITCVKNMGDIAGLNARTWTGHAKVPTISYGSQNGSNSAGKTKVDISAYPILKKGNTGKYVNELKQALIEKGYKPYSDIFDDATLTAVKKYQSENVDADGKPLVVDGYVGPKTWSSIYK